MKKNKVVTTEDILLKLCQSVSGVLTSATSSQVSYSAMVQKINKTSLKPDFGCFVLFDGGFSGLVVINFTAKAALEIYTNYMRNMGMPEEELAISHTSDEVADVLGELMNQLVGDFTNKIRKELTSVSKAELFAQTFAANSTLDDSGHVPPTLTISCLSLKFLRMKFSMPFLGLTLGRLMDLMEFPLLFPLC